MASRISIFASQAFSDRCALLHSSMATRAYVILKAWAEDVEVRTAVGKWEATLATPTDEAAEAQRVKQRTG